MNIGGQAVIEGVMMRNKEKFAVAVRLPDGSIKLKKEKSSKYHRFFEAPFLRGVIGLFYMLYDGMRALIWSSNQNLGVDEQLTKKEVIFTISLSMLFAVLFFVVLPFFTARWLGGEGVLFDILDGVFRVILVVGYMWGISFMDDVKRLFAYHGAEHKTIYCYESGKKLTVENVREFSRFHPRCGTSFVFVVLLVSIVLFSILQGSLVVEFVGRIVLMPVVAGLSYELIKLSEKLKGNIVVRWLITPGLWLQRITTNEPDEKQLEVGIKALKAVLDD